MRFIWIDFKGEKSDLDAGALFNKPVETIVYELIVKIMMIMKKQNKKITQHTMKTKETKFSMK